VGVELAKWLKKRHYTYRIIILPETIGSMAYLSHNEELIPEFKAGIFLEMMGNDNQLHLQFSRSNCDTPIDNIAYKVLDERFNYDHDKYRVGRFREVIVNDELVWDQPTVGVPTISLSRWPYPEYHTSDDTPSILSEARLQESLEVVQGIIDVLDTDYVPKPLYRGIPFLSGAGYGWTGARMRN